jgi:hypothetical protein
MIQEEGENAQGHSDLDRLGIPRLVDGRWLEIAERIKLLAAQRSWWRRRLRLWARFEAPPVISEQTRNRREPHDDD